MKVVRIIARLNVGGPARHVAWLEAGLRRAGVESLLVSGVVPPGEDDMSYFARSLGVEPVVIPEMSREISPKDAVTVWKLYRLLRRERPDLVHTHTAKAGTAGRLAGLLYRWATPSALRGRPRPCRFVHTYHGHIFHSYYGRLKTRFFLAVERTLARLVTDRIVVISPQQLREIHEEFGVGRREQFRVVPLGLDVRAFDRWDERRGAARAAWGAADEDVLVGIVGRLTEVKNHELFLRAAARYRELRASGEAPPGRVRFVVVGDGHLRPRLESLAAELGLAGEVTFAGTRDDPENFYPALDVVALTSLNEGTPLTLIEAMANARAVVATAVGGVVDLVGEPAAGGAADDGDWQVCERGVRVRPRDAETFARALARLVESEELRDQLGRRGRRFVEERYSVERLLSDVLALYGELAAAAGAALPEAASSARRHAQSGGGAGAAAAAARPGGPESPRGR
ncbi:MAG TPA: glycosyltransferase [Pyrinomonadaceae bacterium]|nr:glycosyltransferase [Pyrinomonadaceae bacterium]